MTRKAALSIIATLAVLIAAVAYLVVDVLKADPFADRIHVTVTAPKSNGLHEGSAVLLHGAPIGKVTDVQYAGDSVKFTMAYDAKYEVPANTELSIENQSMLGESGVFLTPPTTGSHGLLSDGQSVKADIVEVPASVPELLGSTQRLLTQFNPDLVNDLVDEISESIAGIGPDVAKLAPASRLLASSMIASQPDLEALIRNSLQILDQADWVGSALRDTAPHITEVSQQLFELVTATIQFTVETNGGQRVMDYWKPQLEKLAAIGAAYMPMIAGQLPTLLPYAREAADKIPTLNMAELMQQALTVVPGDSVRLTLQAPN